jgi:hypothetical protein
MVKIHEKNEATPGHCWRSMARNSGDAKHLRKYRREAVLESESRSITKKLWTEEHHRDLMAIPLQ